MANRLPEKLTSMRKQLGYSQGDIAEKMNIPVAEFMHWENGTSIPSIHSLKKLADIFGIKVEMLVDNTVEVELPQISTESVEIPFIQPSAEETKTVDLNKVSDMGATRPVSAINTVEFQPTVSSQIVDDDGPMEGTQTRPIIRPAKPTRQQKKKTAMIIAGVGFTQGFHIAWVIIGILGVVALICTLVFKPARIIARDKQYRREAGLPEEGLSKSNAEMMGEK